jgi:hypothetical protein
MAETRATIPTRQDSVRRVLVFLKRRWFLLSCSLGFLAGTFLNFEIIPWTLTEDPEPRTGAGWLLAFQQGTLVFIHGDEITVGGLVNQLPLEFQTDDPGIVQPPRLVIPPSFRYSKGSFLVVIPFWLLLSASVGWIVFREARWREKMRAKESGL